MRKKEGVMPIVKKLRELFDEAKVSYEVYNHPLAYTAQEIAAKQHFSGDAMAKVVILKVDGALAMAVLMGSDKVSLATVRESLNAREVQLATEDDFVARFPDCEIGAMPPFGNLFGMPVYVDPALEKDEYIYFNAGNHVQTVRLSYKDYERLVHPRVVRMTAAKRKAA
jgi:Ala-tRNA(Pro) deacylase